MTLTTGYVVDLSSPNLWVDSPFPCDPDGQDGVPDSPATHAIFRAYYATVYYEPAVGPYFGYVYAYNGCFINEDGNDASETRSYFDFADPAFIKVIGTGGDDSLASVASLQGLAIAVSVQLKLFGEDGNDELLGGHGNDRLFGGNDNDSLTGGIAGYPWGSTEPWTIGLPPDDDYLSGGEGNDSLQGLHGHDRLCGGNGNDVLIGGLADFPVVSGIRVWMPDNDYLDGGAGNDSLSGGVGSDRLIGGAGTDELTGGRQRDRFIFNDVADSQPGENADTITDFTPGRDTISLAKIDAISGGADDAFSLIGHGPFTGNAGELRFEWSEGTTRIAADVNGDGLADMEIVLTGNIALTAADFIL